MNKENQYVPGMLGCSDGGCIFEYKRPGTMVTNGGCQCQKELMRTEAGMNAYRTIMWMRSNWPHPAFAGDAVSQAGQHAYPVDNSGHTWMPLENFNELRYTAYEDSPVPTYRNPQRTMQSKVNMIKEIRESTGSGLRECKEAMDAVYPLCTTFNEVVAMGVQYIRSGKQTPSKAKYDYTCDKPDGCYCGGDTQGVRQSCAWYAGKQL